MPKPMKVMKTKVMKRHKAMKVMKKGRRTRADRITAIEDHIRKRYGAAYVEMLWESTKFMKRPYFLARRDWRVVANYCKS